MRNLLTVPLIRQDTKDNCWYASACMLAYYRSPGPRPGVPDRTGGNRTRLNGADFVRLGASEGLKALPDAKRTWTPADFGSALTAHGPLWCAGRWHGEPHVVVVTGVWTYKHGTRTNGTFTSTEHEVVMVNDPAKAAARKVPIADFNAKLSRNEETPILWMPAVGAGNIPFLPQRWLDGHEPLGGMTRGRSGTIGGPPPPPPPASGGHRL